MPWKQTRKFEPSMAGICLALVGAALLWLPLTLGIITARIIMAISDRRLAC